MTFKTIAKIKRININYNPQTFSAKRCDSTIKKSQSNKPFYSLFLVAVAIKMLVDYKFFSWFLLFFPGYDVFLICATIKRFKGGFRGGPRGPRPPSFFEILYFIFIEFSEK